MTGINRYYEDLRFDSGSKINVSQLVDTRYFNTVHWHPYVEVLVSLCDGNETTIRFTRYQLKKHDIAVVYSGDLHAVHYVREDSFLIIQFPLALLAVMGELNVILPRLSRLNRFPYDPDRAESREAESCVEAIASHYFSEDPFREVLVYADLLRLFTLLGRQCVQGDSPEDGTAAGTDQANLKLMTEACLYIAENCMKPIQLPEVAARVGVSRSHFAHLFKNYTNMTFVEFLTIERIRLAETFFRNPQLRMTDIAFESGFSSISSFNRSFRKIKGCSPTEFRETMID